MGVKLVFETGPAAGKRFSVDGSITMGRDQSNDIVLNDPAVSLVHCQIFFDGEYPHIKDLGSTNGTKVNGHRIIRAELRDRDVLMIGKNEVRVSVVSVSASTVVGTPLAPVTTEVRASSAAGELEEEQGRALKDEELSGNIFGRVTYFLKRKIADGGMGSVYEAEQFGAEGFIKKVAIKTILPKYVRKASFIASFVGEAKLVANLVHQNIVQIHHLGRHEDGYYISMEYIDGVNLTDFLDAHYRLRRKMPVEIATFIVSRICRGLEYAHNKKDDAGTPLGLVHRDVSPNNIMITTEGEVKLTDFGVAMARHFMDDDTGYLVGSVEYMSPEQARCDTVDRRSDLFSLGLVYYELLTSIRVFQCEDDDIDRMVEVVQECEIPDIRGSRPDIPETTEKMLMRCLAKKPEDRFQSASELGYALENEMYSKGYGPTIVTLAGYLEELRQADRSHV